MNSHVHRVAALVVIDLHVVEVSAEASVFFGLDGNAIGASTIDCNRTCITGEHKSWTCADVECLYWLGNAVSKGSSEAEAKTEQRSNDRCS